MKNLAVVIGIGIMCAALMTATTSPHTPLYTVRMEQESNKMNFLPTEVNQFTYTAENGCTVLYEVSLCGVHPLEEPTVPETCPNTCDDETCYGPTCPETSCNTCSTCSSTCNTCTQPTCETCEETCPYTCSTCSSTCWNTCSGYTCKDTCEIDCWP